MCPDRGATSRPGGRPVPSPRSVRPEAGRAPATEWPCHDDRRSGLDLDRDGAFDVRGDVIAKPLGRLEILIPNARVEPGEEELLESRVVGRLGRRIPRCELVSRERKSSYRTVSARGPSGQDTSMRSSRAAWRALEGTCPKCSRSEIIVHMSGVFTRSLCCPQSTVRLRQRLLRAPREH